MQIQANQHTTKLGTSRTFNILRPEGFPAGKQGLVFLTSFDTGFGDERRMLIRADAPSGKWRIDRHVTGRLFEAVLGYEGLYESPEAAAKVLEGYRPV